MRARPTLLLMIVAACLAIGPATPAHASRSTPSGHPASVVAVNHAQRARFAAFAVALTNTPSASIASPSGDQEPEPAPQADPTPAPVDDSGYAAAALNPSSYIWPARARIGSPFGRRGGTHHDGVDIMAARMAPIVAAQTGIVTSAAWESGYGNTVNIDHGKGMSTKYAHQTKFVVHAGQHVTQGQLIGYVGSTGRVSAPHLHYEVHVDGVPRNPMTWLPSS